MGALIDRWLDRRGVLATAKVKVIINRKTNAVRFADLNDIVILSEDEFNGKTMAVATIAGIPTYNCNTVFNSPAGGSMVWDVTPKIPCQSITRVVTRRC